MSLTWNKALCVVLTIGCVASPVRSFGDSVREQHVNVVVRIGSGVPPLIARRGIREATRIFRRGGVVIEWRDSAVGHEHSCLHLMLLRHDAIRGGASRAALGTTPRGPGESGRISYVFLEPIEILASSHSVDVALFLGAAIAHELGHLLLPDRDHTKEGLMRPSWGGAEAKAANRGALRFLPSDFTAMRVGSEQVRQLPLLQRAEEADDALDAIAVR